MFIAMKETDIRKYASLMKELGLTGLEITDDKSKVRLEMNTSPTVETVLSVPTSGKPDLSDKSEGEGSQSAVTADYISVKSPIVGVFYAAPAENAEPYVTVGTGVKKGQTLCIIEAMKLMNEIVSEHDGVIAEICVTNGQIVEYGTELFRIKSM